MRSSITLRHTTFGRILLDEWSIRRRDLYLTTCNAHKRQTSLPPGGIRTHNPSKLEATGPPLRTRGHRDRLLLRKLAISMLLYSDDFAGVHNTIFVCLFIGKCSSSLSNPWFGFAQKLVSKNYASKCQATNGHVLLVCKFCSLRSCSWQINHNEKWLLAEYPRLFTGRKNWVL